jgi:chemotaxis regulatin CheY-phosphate phosphatase CheZ
MLLQRQRLFRHDSDTQCFQSLTGRSGQFAREAKRDTGKLRKVILDLKMQQDL